jgi:hypothetical protein
MGPDAGQNKDRREIEIRARELFKEDRRSLICRNKTTGWLQAGTSIPKKYFSTDLVKYFYITCGALEPKITSLIGTDFIDGESLASCNDSEIPEDQWKPCVRDYLFESPSISDKKAIVKVRYHLVDWRKLYTKLYFVREGDSWKVDDIEVWGDAKGFGSDPGNEGNGSSFRSLKTLLKRQVESK